MEVRVCIHIRRRKRIYIRSAYCMNVQPLLVLMAPSISVNSGPYDQKLIFFNFLNKVVQISVQHQQAQVESNEKSSPVLMDHGTAEI